MSHEIIQDRILESAPYPLYRALEQGVALERLLIKGRWLESSAHDHEAQRLLGKHMHWYRRVLETYDPKMQKVLLSKKGSRRLKEELETPDREYSLEELGENNPLNGMSVRPANRRLY